MSTQAATAAARRSKITPERETELYDAVICLLREGGYDSVTMEGVAACVDIESSRTPLSLHIRE